MLSMNKTSITNCKLVAMSCKGMQVGFAWLFKFSRIRCTVKVSPPLQPRRAVPKGWAGKDEKCKVADKG